MILLTTALLLTAPANEPPKESINTSIQISLKERGTDYKEAFETLKKEKGGAKVFFQLTNGTTISNIIDMHLTENGHLILFKYNTQQGIKHQVVPVEQIATLSYLP